MQNQFQGAEVLQQILKAALQGGVGMAQNNTNDMAQRPVAGQIAKASGVQDPGNGPVEMLMQLIGGVGKTASASENDPSMTYGFGVQPQQKSQPDAFSKGSDKALQEYGYKSTMEAVMAGMSPMAVMQERSKMGGGDAMNQMAPLLQNLLSMAQQPTQQPQQTTTTTSQISVPRVDTPNIRRQGMFETNANYGIELDNVGKRQKIMGQEPIQPTTALTQGIELAKANATANSTRYQNIISQENVIAQQYIKDFEPLKQATDSVGRITELYEDSLRNPNNNVNDFFLVYNAIKAADPTAVKEGEYKTVQELMPFASKVLNGINFKIKGETLTPDQRSRLVKAAVTQYNGLAKRFEPMAKEYERKVRAYEGNPERALTNYGAKGKSSTFKVTPIGE